MTEGAFMASPENMCSMPSWYYKIELVTDKSFCDVLCFGFRSFGKSHSMNQSVNLPMNGTVIQQSFGTGLSRRFYACLFCSFVGFVFRKLKVWGEVLHFKIVIFTS